MSSLSWWWWGGAVSAPSAAPAPTPPAELVLSVSGTPVTWYYRAKPFKALYFQPGDCACGCQTWTDLFTRAALGADWEAISGSWTTGVGVGLRPASDGMVLSTRAARAKCFDLPAFWVDFVGTLATLRLYFDWLDADNHHYIELTTSPKANPDGGEYGLGLLSIYRVTEGDSVLLAGPEETFVEADKSKTLRVQFAYTGEDGEVYVEAISGHPEDPVFPAVILDGSWIGCVTEFLGNRFGLAVTADEYVTDPPAFGPFRQTDCYRLTPSTCLEIPSVY